MEKYLFPWEFLTDGWLSSSPTTWAVNAALAFIWGLGLFFLLLSYFQPDPSLPPGKKHRKSRKCQAEPRGSNRRKKNQTLKVFRDCLQDLEEVQDLFSLLQRRKITPLPASKLQHSPLEMGSGHSTEKSALSGWTREWQQV
ncbi:spermatogenesis-associated protein 31E1-like [Mustela erminea]|uniref:spermatogenesis-associated protein 31E1-like n=1 Tax=Mustela erminea TaxID=36723 RepID=UPI0013875F7E|nr:spermatogenesis-associated protein 31E1-like [Mustela erminea]